MKGYETRGSKVLIADDDQSIRQLVTTIIEREGIHVDAVGDGVEAIEKLKEEEYQVILLDLMMPRLDGFGVIDYLKQNPPQRKPVVLVITAYADQTFKEVDASIVAGVLRKPFEVADLGNLVRLCAGAYDQTVSQKLFYSKDRAIREFARQHLRLVDYPPMDRSGDGNGRSAS